MEIKNLWNKIPKEVQLEIVSAWHTFSTAFVIELAADVYQQAWLMPLSKQALIALGAAALRVVLKAFWNGLAALVKQVIGWLVSNVKAKSLKK